MVAAAKDFEPLLLTVPEAATALRLCKRKVWSLLAGGEIPAVRIGRAVRVDTTDIRDLIAASKAGK